MPTKNAVVSAVVFNSFVVSSEAATMTQAEQAKKLGMKHGSFMQRLNQYRATVREAEKLAKESGMSETEIAQLVKARMPKFAKASRGPRTVNPAVRNEKLLAFLRGE